MEPIKSLSDNENDVVQSLLAEDGLALYSSRPAESRGRVYKERPSKTRGDFERDRDRIIHSTAFRRLRFKTQVFVQHEGDHYRTRLSHSLEVAQVARSLARILKVDEDLAEICGLAHDLGHTPFAHVGEDALKECMEPYGGFDHNDQTLRVVSMLEKKYPDFDGLNLTWESLEGLVKHNGPVVKKGEDKKLEVTLDWLKDQIDMKLDTYASLEAQLAGISDDIAYNSHDLDDGFTSNVFSIKDVEQNVPWVAEIIQAKREEYPNIDNKILAQETVREVMGVYVLDVLAETKKRLAKLQPKSADDIRHTDSMTAAMSEDMKKRDRSLRDFLWSHFYRHHRVLRMRLKIFKVVQELFTTFMDEPRSLPRKYFKRIQDIPEGWEEKNWHARVVADYIASMTDRFALLEHQELFDTTGVVR